MQLRIVITYARQVTTIPEPLRVDRAEKPTSTVIASLRRPRGWLRAAAVLVTSLSLALAGAATPAPALTLRPVVLTAGHVDLFEVTYDAATSKLKLSVGDDTRQQSSVKVYRDPETVTTVIDPARSARDSSKLGSDYAFLGVDGPTVYLLPQAQDASLPWPGWSTERLGASLPAGVELAAGQPVQLILSISGPGNVFTWQTGTFGEVTNRYVDTVDPAVDRIPVGANSHVHTNWAFTKPGDYLLTVTPTATTSAGATIDGASASYHLRVGSATDDPAPVATEVSGSALTQVYGTSAVLRASVSPSAASGEVSTVVGGTRIRATLAGGVAKLTVPAKSLAPGRYTLMLTYSGQAGRYLTSSTRVSITVAKAPATLTLSAATKVKRGKTLTVRVAVSSTGLKPSGKVTVKVAGVSKTVTLSGGKATAKVKLPVKAKRGEAAVKVSYSGDSLIAAGSASRSVRIS